MGNGFWWAQCVIRLMTQNMAANEQTGDLVRPAEHTGIWWHWDDIETEMILRCYWDDIETGYDDTEMI